MPALRVMHFSDVLCIWAHVGQIRIEELCRVFGTNVDVDYHFVTVFGDVHGRLAERWKDRGGLTGYAQHVREIAARFEHVRVHEDVWTRDVPASSLGAHLFLHAVQLVAGRAALERCASALRAAFFTDVVDVGRRARQLEVAEGAGVPVAAVERELDGGRAAACVARDLQLAREHAIDVSPSLVLGEGRQVLKGNVGYRVIEANVRELLSTVEPPHSWC